MKRKRTVKDWIFATRPWSFPTSVIPIIVAGTYLLYMSKTNGTPFNWTNALLSLPLMMTFHAASNLISDYFDHKKKVDLEDSLNGVRHWEDGKFQPKEILTYGFSLLAVAIVMGIVMLFNSDMSYIWIGVLAILLAVFYPFLKFNALGDADVLLGFAVVPSIGVSYVVTGMLMPEVILISLSFGLITVAVLHANNTRDIKNDTRAGIKTLAIAIGKNVSKKLYVAEITMPYLLIAAFTATGILPAWTLITLVTVPKAISNIKLMTSYTTDDETQIATLDKQTAEMLMMFGTLLTVSIIIATISTTI